MLTGVLVLVTMDGAVRNHALHAHLHRDIIATMKHHAKELVVVGVEHGAVTNPVQFAHLHRDGIVTIRQRALE